MKRTASRHKIKEEHTKEINKSLLHKTFLSMTLLAKKKMELQGVLLWGLSLGNVIMTEIEKISS